MFPLGVEKNKSWKSGDVNSKKTFNTMVSYYFPLILFVTKVALFKNYVGFTKWMNNKLINHFMTCQIMNGSSRYYSNTKKTSVVNSTTCLA